MVQGEMRAAGKPVGWNAPGFGAVEQRAADLLATGKDLFGTKEPVNALAAFFARAESDDAAVVVGRADVAAGEVFELAVFVGRERGDEFEDVDGGPWGVLAAEGGRNSGTGVPPVRFKKLTGREARATDFADAGLPGFNDGAVVEEEGGVGIAAAGLPADEEADQAFALI